MVFTQTTTSVDLTHYESVRPRLGLRFAHPVRHHHLLEQCPSASLLDLRKLPYIQLDTGERSSQLLPIDRAMVQRWGIAPGQLLADAEANMSHIAPPSFMTLEKMLDLNTESSGLYVLTNIQGLFGATAILYPGLLREIFELLGRFYVLPSSIHEVIIVRDSEAFTPADLSQIVRHVNRNEVTDDDYLSDSVYFYGENGLCLQQAETVKDE